MNKKILIITTLLLVLKVNFLYAQKDNCVNKFDSTSIITYIQKKGELLLPRAHTLEQIIDIPSMAPKATFNSEKCQWTVISSTSEYSNKGKCKNTNGCTITNSKVVCVDAKTGKILSKKQSKQVYPNYE